MRDDHNTLLSSRLKGAAKAPAAKEVDISSLRHKTEDDGSIPEYDSSPEKKHRLFHKKQPIEPAKPLEPADDFDATLEQEFEFQAVKKRRSSSIKNKLILCTQIILILSCVYVSFLIYGLTVTQYVYNDDGQVAPEVLSLSDLQTLNQYEAFSAYYLRARILYEKTLKLDYQLSIAPDSALVIAMDYTALLDEVAKLSVDISAADIDTGYTSIYSQLLNWVKTDIAVYLQNVSAAITNNDAEKANNAVISRDVMYSDFSRLTANAVALAQSTKGANDLSIYDWSPESYSAALAGGDGNG